MLGAIRNFSKTIYAKVLMGIIIIPFVLWGMGGVFSSGGKNTVAYIGSEKISTKEFVDHFNRLNLNQEDIELNPNLIDEVLSVLIGNKVIFLETQDIGIEISNDALAKMIRNENFFQKDNKFSRTKYEKFLLESKISATQFEQNLKEQEKKRMLLTFVAGGIKSPKFFINEIYNQENQIRDVEILDLNKLYAKDDSFTEKQIKEYFESNSEKFKNEYRSFNYLELTPANLVGEEDFNELFFKKLDEIEDLIVNTESLDEISNKYNLKILKTNLINKNGEESKNGKKSKFKKDILNKLFEVDSADDIYLIKSNDKYFVVKLEKKENILLKIDSDEVRNKILNILKMKNKFEKNLENLKKISKDNFNKLDFEKMAKEKNLKITKFKIKNLNDETNLSKNLLKQIYKIPPQKFNIVADESFQKNWIVYIDNVYNKKIDINDSLFNNYLLKSNKILAENIYSTYDSYINKKYKVKINHQALERVKNFYK